MPFEPICEIDDPRLADYRSVSDPELARARGLFIAEGRLVVQRVIADGRYTVRSVLVSEASRRDLESSLALVSGRAPIFVCQSDAFKGITGYHLHRGCVALVERPPARTAADVLRVTELAVVLEAVANADNVGGVFRNAAAFGAGAELLGPGCCDPLYRKAIRTSMAATLSVPFAWLDGWPASLLAMRQAGFALVVLSPRQPSETLDEFVKRNRPSRLALVIGAEGPGVTAAVAEMADYRVRIPMRAEIDSLNLAVAAGIALHRLGRGSCA
jgi:tRNA G18 (ribose-2'-O)-methylase SpoU